MLEQLADPEVWVALATLTALEIVLGIDNIIFLSVLIARLPEAQRPLARRLGLGLAMVARLGLLFSISWVMGLTRPWVHLLGHEISGRDVILIGGGLFLLAKATHDIHESLEGTEQGEPEVRVGGMGMALAQIALLDLVFSLDSVITAVGLVNEVAVMAVAIVLAVAVMLVAARSIGDFVDQHPTIKILALSFLILVGFTLMMEGVDVHVPKGYIYFAMAFSVVVELLNLRLRRKLAVPVKLHSRYGQRRET